MYLLTLKKIPSFAPYGLVRDAIKKTFKLERSDIKLIYKVKSGQARVFFKDEQKLFAILSDVQSETVESEEKTKDKDDNGLSSDEDLEKLAKLNSFLELNQIKLAKSTLFAKFSIETPVEKKHENKSENQPVEPVDIRNVVTPLWEMSYQEQLNSKKIHLDRFLRKKGQKPSESIIGYDSDCNYLQRNTFEFAFGFDTQNCPVIGFRGNTFMSNKNLVHVPLEVGFINDEIKSKILKVNEMLAKKEFEGLIHDRVTETGHLKFLKVKMNAKMECLAVVDIQIKENLKFIDEPIPEDKDPQDNTSENNSEKLKNTEENELARPVEFQQAKNSKDISKKDLDNIDEKLHRFLESLSFENIFVTFNSGQFEGFSSKDLYKIRGSEFLEENVDDFFFRLSPFGFFQCNIYILLEIIKKIANNFDKKNEILLDLCCGQMTLGILLSKWFKKIVGVENNPQSFIEFDESKKVNKIDNCEIINIDVNTISIEKLLRENHSKENEKCSSKVVDGAKNQADFSQLPEERKTCTAILDPPRAGVHKKLIKRLRKVEEITELFYVSCDYKKSFENIQDLIRERSNAYGEPFELVNIWCFDMFVESNGVEVLYHFKRPEKIE